MKECCDSSLVGRLKKERNSQYSLFEFSSHLNNKN